MARFQPVAAPAHAKVYQLNGRLAPVERTLQLNATDVAMVGMGALFFGVAGALAGALLHI